jgi:hypothetical protein
MVEISWGLILFNRGQWVLWSFLEIGDVCQYHQAYGILGLSLGETGYS